MKAVDDGEELALGDRVQVDGGPLRDDPHDGDRGHLHGGEDPEDLENGPGVEVAPDFVECVLQEFLDDLAALLQVGQGPENLKGITIVYFFIWYCV